MQKVCRKFIANMNKVYSIKEEYRKCIERIQKLHRKYVESDNKVYRKKI